MNEPINIKKNIHIYIYIHLKYEFIRTNNVTVFQACATIRRENDHCWGMSSYHTSDKMVLRFYQNAAKNEVDSVFTEPEIYPPKDAVCCGIGI